MKNLYEFSIWTQYNPNIVNGPGYDIFMQLLEDADLIKRTTTIKGTICEIKGLTKEKAIEVSEQWREQSLFYQWRFSCRVSKMLKQRKAERTN